MASAKHLRPWPAWLGKRLLSFYPPWLFGRIRVVALDSDYRRCRIRVARSLLTVNLNGSTFGGTLFSAADPVYALMYQQRLIRRGMPVRAWLRRAEVRYLKPAREPVTLDFVLDDTLVEEAMETIGRHDRYSRTHTVEAVAPGGDVCASFDTEIYLRSICPDGPPT